MLERPRYLSRTCSASAPPLGPPVSFGLPKGWNACMAPAAKPLILGNAPALAQTWACVCWEGRCALHPARPGVGQSLVLLRDSEGQNPWDLRSQALGPAAGTICLYGKGFPSLPAAPGPELLQGLQSSLSSLP